MENTSEQIPAKVQKRKRQIDIISIVEIAIGYAVGYALGIQLLIFIPSIVLGFCIARYYVLKKKLLEKRWVKIILWSNIGSWIFPFLGVFTSIFTIQIGQLAQADKKRNLILGILGLVLSVTNFALGIYLKSGQL